MGEPAQKRLIRKLDLERFLSEVKPHPSPDASLEQYTTSEAVAATMLYLAAYTYDDIEGKRILDLGCGTGRLSLGAAFLGAQSVVGVDIDKTAIKAACENAGNVGLEANVDWVVGDIDAVTGSFDTVLQNPPFGVQKRAADRKFLEKALEVGNVTYSLHNHPYTDTRLLSRLKASGGGLLQDAPSPFIQRFVEAYGGRVEAVFTLPLVIPRMFDFHTKARHEIIIDLYVIRKNE
jgi:putative methylase